MTAITFCVIGDPMSARVTRAVQNDDVNELQQMIACGLSIDFVLETPADSDPDLLKLSPPLISLAAFYGAEKCFRYLLVNGANIELVDSVSSPFTDPFSHCSSNGRSFRGHRRRSVNHLILE
jgi:hypothetical protein